MTFPRHVHKGCESKIIRADEWDQALREGWSEHPVCAEPFVTADPNYVYPSGPVYGRPEPPVVPPPPPSLDRLNSFTNGDPFSRTRLGMETADEDGTPIPLPKWVDPSAAPKKRGRPKRGE